MYFGGQAILLQWNAQEDIVATEEVSTNLLIAGGIPVGIYMDTSGIMVINTTTIQSIDGSEVAPAQNIVQAGDYITAINGVEIGTKKQLLDQLETLEDESVELNIRRSDEDILVNFDAVLSESGNYMLGLWVRDNLQGLGTLTYVAPNGEFGALGHGIYDIDTSELLEISEGELYQATINGIIKGESGEPGGLEGVIVYSPAHKLGTISQNTEVGIYGRVDDIEALELDEHIYPMGEREEVMEGSAFILSTIQDEVEVFDIEIEQINRFETEVNKGMIVRVVDEDLLSMTGGIIQGMSGSPIIQNGKIIGAVTHVFVNDPTRGYGIFIENMLDNSK